MNSRTASIDKLMFWRGSWTKYDRKVSNLFLHIVYDQLLITADTKIIESFNMHSKMKGIYKDDVLILIVSGNNSEIRKIKFQIKLNVAQCLEELGSRFPVVPHNVANTNHVINLKYRNINDVFKHALDHKGSSSSSSLPSEFEHFVKICLLDPSFPQMVTDAEKILNTIISK